ncbi:MAG: T9SS type A sorting domain-containing protein, partial [FCB group bacterium]
QPTGNEIQPDLTAFGTQGFRYDKTKLTFPIVLQQGEFIEFEGQFVAPNLGAFTAALASKSNAEAEVVSNWTGSGKQLGVQPTGGTATTCNGTTADIICNLANVGTDPIMIDSVRIIPENPQSIGLFNFKTAADSLAAYLLAFSATKDITITYTARRDSITVPPPPQTTHKAWILVYSVKNGALKVDTCEVTGTAEFFTRTTKVTVPPTAVRIASPAHVSLQIGPGNSNDMSDAGVNQLDVTITYNGSFLKVVPNNIHVGSLLQGNFTLQNVKITDNPGIITLSLVSQSTKFNYTAGEILNLDIDTYLPKDSNNASPVTFTIATSNPNCAVVSGVNGPVSLQPTCEYNLRKVAISTTAYSLESVNPNPVINNTAAINFGVGIDGYTEIRIFNTSGAIIAVPVQEELKTGTYTINLDVTNMPSGVYYYEMASGPFRKLEKMVITR